MTAQSLSPLTSLRFIAAGAVLLHHRPRIESTTHIPFEEHGAAGVSFFFLLSGFILAYTYRTRLVPWAPREGWNFLVARFARLWPVYLLAFVGLFWVCFDGQMLLAGKFGSAFWRAVAFLTMTQAHAPQMEWYFAYNPPGWSLSAEWTFYLLFPLILNGLATGSWGRRIAVFLAASAMWATACALLFTAPVDAVATEPRKWNWLIYICPFTRLFDFNCGVVLGLLFVHLKPAVGPAQGTRFWLWGLVEVGVLGALGAGMYFSPEVLDAIGRPMPLNMLSGLGYYLPFFALIVWVGALGRGPLSRLASTRLPVYLGEISYGVYIFHFPIIIVFALHFYPAGWSEGERMWLILALAAVSAMTLSAVSYHLYELPLRHWLRKKLSWNAPPAVVVPEVASPEPLRRAA